MDAQRNAARCASRAASAWTNLRAGLGETQQLAWVSAGRTAARSTRGSQSKTPATSVTMWHSAGPSAAAMGRRSGPTRRAQRHVSVRARAPGSRDHGDTPASSSARSGAGRQTRCGRAEAAPRHPACRRAGCARRRERASAEARARRRGPRRGEGAVASRGCGGRRRRRRASGDAVRRAPGGAHHGDHAAPPRACALRRRAASRTRAAEPSEVRRA